MKIRADPLDEPKRHANLAKHRLDFVVLTVEFFEASLVVVAKEGRFKALGRLADGSIAASRRSARRLSPS